MRSARKRGVGDDVVNARWIKGWRADRARVWACSIFDEGFGGVSCGCSKDPLPAENGRLGMEAS